MSPQLQHIYNIDLYVSIDLFFLFVMFTDSWGGIPHLKMDRIKCPNFVKRIHPCVDTNSILYVCIPSYPDTHSLYFNIQYSPDYVSNQTSTTSSRVARMSTWRRTSSCIIRRVPAPKLSLTWGRWAPACACPLGSTWWSPPPSNLGKKLTLSSGSSLKNSQTQSKFLWNVIQCTIGISASNVKIWMIKRGIPSVFKEKNCSYS